MTMPKSSLFLRIGPLTDRVLSTDNSEISLLTLLAVLQLTVLLILLPQPLCNASPAMMKFLSGGKFSPLSHSWLIISSHVKRSEGSHSSIFRTRSLAPVTKYRAKELLQKKPKTTPIIVMISSDLFCIFAFTNVYNAYYLNWHNCLEMDKKLHG